MVATIGASTLVLETGAIATRDDGCVTLRYGDAVVLCTVSATQSLGREGAVELTVHDDAAPAGAGRIDRLAARSIGAVVARDRGDDDVQITVTVLSHDPAVESDVLAICAAGAALAISDIPFRETVAAVRVGRDENGDHDFVANPALEQYESGGMEIVVTGTATGVVMVDGGAQEISEDDFLSAVEFAHGEIKKIVAAIDELAKKAGKAKRELPPLTPGEPGFDVVTAIEEEELRTRIVDERIRPDGRKPDEIRPIWCKVHYVPRAHGSGVFTCGQTQVFSAATLSSYDPSRLVHSMRWATSAAPARVMPWSHVREAGPGEFAQRALAAVLPPEDEFPYTLRVTSDVLEADGSPATAAVCGSTLALLDAGVPIKAHVAAVAMGLIRQGSDYATLADVQGIENALSEMDFNVAGTVHGITAIQIDIKAAGITTEVMRKALARCEAVAPVHHR